MNAINDVRARIAVWLDDDQELRIPDTPWGRALYADLRELLAASSHDEWACKGNQDLFREAAAERDALRATVARVEAQVDDWETRSRRGDRTKIAPDWAANAIRAALTGRGESDD